MCIPYVLPFHCVCYRCCTDVLVHGCMLSSINKWIVYIQLQRASGSYTYDSHLLECTYCVCTPGNVVIINTPSDTCEYPASIYLLNVLCAFPLSSDRDH